MPSNADTPDLAELAYAALRVIGFAEERSVTEVLADLEYGGADLVSVRLAPDVPSGQAPLPLADAAISALRLLVIGAAAGLDAGAATLPPRRPRAERYAESVRLSTSPGSFVVSLALPVFERPDRATEVDGQTRLDEVLDVQAPAFGRDVTRRMRAVTEQASALASRIEAEGDDVTAFEVDPNATGNATGVGCPLAHRWQGGT